MKLRLLTSAATPRIPGGSRAWVAHMDRGVTLVPFPGRSGERHDEMKLGILKRRKLFWALILASAAGWAGYRLRDARIDTVLVSAASAVPGFEYLSPPESYSRIENTKRNLQTLCARLRLEAERDLLAESTGGGQTHPLNQSRHLETAIGELERGLREFRGTEQEIEVAQDLFPILKSAGRFERWTQVYLQIVHERPTHPTVGRLAKEALAIARVSGREPQVLAAFEHLRTSPFDSENKEKIETALAEAKPNLVSNRLDSTSSADGEVTSKSPPSWAPNQAIVQ